MKAILSGGLLLGSMILNSGFAQASTFVCSSLDEAYAEFQINLEFTEDGQKRASFFDNDTWTDLTCEDNEKSSNYPAPDFRCTEKPNSHRAVNITFEWIGKSLQLKANHVELYFRDNSLVKLDYSCRPGRFY